MAASIYKKEDLAEVLFVNFENFLRTLFYGTPLGDCFWLLKIPKQKLVQTRRQEKALEGTITSREACYGVYFISMLWLSAFSKASGPYYKWQ